MERKKKQKNINEENIWRIEKRLVVLFIFWKKEQGVSKCHNKISLRSILLFHFDTQSSLWSDCYPLFFS